MWSVSLCLCVCFCCCVIVLLCVCVCAFLRLVGWFVVGLFAGVLVSLKCLCAPLTDCITRKTTTCWAHVFVSIPSVFQRLGLEK